MKNRLDNYKREREDLTRQIELCQFYKEKIKETLANLRRQYEAGILDYSNYINNVNYFLKKRPAEDWYATYDEHINKCYSNIGYYDEKINESSEKKKIDFSLLFVVVGVFSLIISMFVFIQPTITGLVPQITKSQMIFEDGFTKEGTHWLEIQGSRIYERCLQVNSEIDFNSINVIAKITSATDDENIIFSLYRNDDLNDEPSLLVGSCEVSNYDDLWKSCRIDNLYESGGEYWICASNSDGDTERIYYTIAYQNGDNRKTALWTGENWQKLDRSSYTIKAQFIKNEK